MAYNFYSRRFHSFAWIPSILFDENYLREIERRTDLYSKYSIIYWHFISEGMQHLWTQFEIASKYRMANLNYLGIELNSILDFVVRWPLLKYVLYQIDHLLENEVDKDGNGLSDKFNQKYLELCDADPKKVKNEILNII